MQSLKRAFNRVLSTSDLTQPGTSQSKRSKTNTDNKQADIIEEIFNTVLSQGVEGDNNGANAAVYNGEFDAEEMEEMEEEAYPCTDHEEHCSLRIEVRRLFRVIQLQRQHIALLDTKLNAVISFVGLQREKPNNNATVRTGDRGPSQSTGGSAGNASGRQNGLQQRNQPNRSNQNKTAQRSAQRPERHTEAANGTNRAGNGRHGEESSTIFPAGNKMLSSADYRKTTLLTTRLHSTSYALTTCQSRLRLLVVPVLVLKLRAVLGDCLSNSVPRNLPLHYCVSLQHCVSQRICIFPHWYI